MASADLIAAYVQGHPDQIGDPVDNGGGVAVHQWGTNGPSVQDFAGRGSSALSTKGRAPGFVMVVVGPNGPKLVRNDFYNTYLGSALGTPNHVSLGAPLDEEHPTVEQAIQSFQNGQMVWTQTTGTRIVFNTPAGEPGQVVPADFVGTFGGHFTLNGRIFRHVGASAQGLIYDTDHDRTNDLSQMKENGIQQVRVFLANDQFSTLEMIDRLTSCANVAKDRGLKLTVTFTGNYHAQFSNPEARGGHFCPPGDDQFFTSVHGSDTLNHDWFANRYQDNYLLLVTEVVGRLKDHSGIFAWEIGNELQDGEVVLQVGGTQAYVNFNTSVAAAIKVIDHNHLVATGMLSCGHNALNLVPDQRDLLYGSRNIDYVTVHVYDNVAFQVQDMLDDVRLARRLGKPVVIEEVGFNGEPGHDDAAQKMATFFAEAYDVIGVDSVMLWGLQFGHDHGNGDAKYGPLESRHIDDFMQLTRTRAGALQATNIPI